MRGNSLYKRAHNRCLDLLTGLEVGADIGSENGLARTLGVSRTTIRTLLEALERTGVVALEGRRRHLRRLPSEEDYFPETETESIRDTVEKKFMDLVLQRDIRPGQQINNLELARQFAVSPSALREYLGEFSQLWLLERRPNSSWIFRGFDLDFVRELSEVRELFEVASAVRFADLMIDDPVWRKLSVIERRHLELQPIMEERFAEFPLLDKSFHELIYSVSRNRFIEQFHGLRNIVFHYHYQWSKRDERQRNTVALDEHLDYISALWSRDPEKIRAAALAHLATARRSLLASFDPQIPEPPGGRGALRRR